jgi:hypothetical protein
MANLGNTQTTINVDIVRAARELLIMLRRNDLAAGKAQSTAIKAALDALNTEIQAVSSNFTVELD